MKLSRAQLLKLSIVAAFMAGIVAFIALDLGQYLSLDELRERREQLRQLTEEHLGLMLLGYVLAYILVAALSIPGAAIMTLAGGALFGILLGSIAASVASTAGATTCFLAARFLFREPLQQRFGKRLKAINDGVERDGAFYLLALRLVPAVPFWMINLMMALTPIRTWTFAWVSWLGMIPATVVYVNAGTQLARIETPGDILSAPLIGAFVLLGLLPLLLRFVLRFLQNRKVYRGHKKPRRFDYNLIVIGAGAGGLVSAYIGATVKAKVALIEKHRMGGDCLNTGCVPSKALIRSARLLAEAERSQEFGIHTMQAEFSWPDIQARIRRVIQRIEPHDSRERYEAMGVDVIEGTGRLASPWEVDVDGRRISARSIVLATGAEPLIPDLPGLDQVDFLTSDTLWDIENLPERLVVLGGGPIGCELSQALARLGCQVSLVEMSERLLPREDPEAGQALAERFDNEGIELALSHRAVRIEQGQHSPVLVCEQQGQERELAFDRILIALGRRTRSQGYGLEELGVVLDERGQIASDGLQRTSFPNIYVCGDAAGPYQFTHVAAHQAWSAAVNGLISPWWSFKTDYRVIPWITFTEPEVARVGLSEEEARARDVDYEVVCYGLDDLDRAIADSNDHGLVKVLTEPGKDTILGATIIGTQASEILPEFVLAMKHGLGLNKILSTIHVYPSYSEAAKYAAGEWKKAHKPEKVLRWAERYFRWRRG